MSAQFLSDLLGAAGIAPERLVLSLANNHICDQGKAGLDETAAQLAAMGIAFVGLENGKEGGWECVSIGDMKIALLAYTRWRNGWPDLYEESVRGAPLAFAKPEEANLACALPHWGTEFAFRPDLPVSEEAARLADAGTDLIVGTHPHVVQPLAQIGTSLVAYSLGDFVGSVLARTPWPLRLSMALAVDFVPGMPCGARIAGYESRLYFRDAVDGRENIDWVETLPALRRKRCETLIARIMRSAEEDTSALDVTIETPAVAR
jgi:poly-gamma-glutamate synthesis protein (capsule biosynthesis protein)